MEALVSCCGDAGTRCGRTCVSAMRRASRRMNGPRNWASLAASLRLVVLLIFFGVFDASVAQASSEASFARVADQSTAICFFEARLVSTSSALGRGQQAVGATQLNLLHALIRGSRSVPELPAADGTAVRHQRTQDGGANKQDLRQLSKQALRLEARDDRTRPPRGPGITAPALRRPAQLRGPAHHHGQRLRGRVEFEFEWRGADLRRGDGRSAARAEIITPRPFSTYEPWNAAA